ncbi:hypothetical protein M9H77_19261 [Catharanthus roseus]|uniref:Uncharacterized protein n=1 Tax=Catharanthus roseus TaxID=4058 RepID=A0ACC0B9W0_CATRO|nr:hypothetical protein M9H77_19261 [Catharanthus roseus]
MEGEAEKLYSVLTPIAKCFKKYKDFVSFNSVCTSWRAASSRENFQGLCLVQETPHLMISTEEEDFDLKFYSLMEEKVVAKVSLPEVKGKKCIESLGWLLVISSQTNMSLMNPFTSMKIELPSQRQFPSHHWVQTNEPYEFIQKMVLSSRPCQASNFVVMVLYGRSKFLGSWRYNEENWKMIEMSRSKEKNWTITQLRDEIFHDLTYCNGQFFAIDSRGSIWACNVTNLNPYQVKLFTYIPYHTNIFQYYIVESLDKLLVLACYKGEENWVPWGREYLVESNNQHWGKISYFELFEVDISSRTWRRINNLGGKALFIGRNSSLLVNASNALKIKANHIYYAGTSNWLHNGGAWVYNLEDKNLEPLERGNLINPMCPPIWISPFF